jgi:type II secretory pathway pseudopilin PulG
MNNADRVRRGMVGRLMKGQRGALLAEIVMVLATFTLLGTAVLSGLQTAYRTKGRVEVLSTTENIIRNQLAYVYEQPYASPGADYLDIVPPTGFTLATDILTYSTTSTDAIERVRISVSHAGETVRTYETVRANR